MIHWRVADGELSVWVHDRDPGIDDPHQTIAREHRPARYPPEVLDLAYREFEQAKTPPMDVGRALAIIADAAFEQIERV